MDFPPLSSGSFPSDIILLILTKLPIKTLFRFKLVSKSWKIVPSNDHFVKLYYKSNSSQNPSLIIEFLDPNKPISDFISIDSFFNISRFSLGFLNDRVKVRASNNGILCCASVRNKGIYYVCNPMTGDFRLLPRTRERPFTRFQQEYEANLVGLAFDPCAYTFNVVLAGFYRPFGHRPHEQLVCLVFDSVSNSWSRFVSNLYEEFTHMNRNQVVYFNGALHWLTHSCSYLLAFDIENYIWNKISMPYEIVANGFGGRIYLLEYEGSISLIQLLGDWMNIWVLKDYIREEWGLEDRVHLRCIRGLSTSAFPISQSKNLIFLATQKKILMYTRKNKVWKEMYDVGENCTYPLWFSTYSFKSTLFPCN